MSDSTAIVQDARQVGEPSEHELVQALLARVRTGRNIGANIAHALVAALSGAISHCTRDVNSRAAQQVFNTTELLEMILLHLDPLELFKIRRLSQHTMATIDGSIKLLDNMFLRLRPTPEISCLRSGCKCVNCLNPDRNAPIFVSPAIRSRLALRCLKLEVNPKVYRAGFMELYITFGSIEQLRAVVPGSWRDMLVVQPYSRKNDRWHLLYTPEVDKDFSKALGSGSWYDALTLGELVDVALERFEELQADPWKSCHDFRATSDRTPTMIGDKRDHAATRAAPLNKQANVNHRRIAVPRKHKAQECGKLETMGTMLSVAKKATGKAHGKPRSMPGSVPGENTDDQDASVGSVQKDAQDMLRCTIN